MPQCQLNLVNHSFVHYSIISADCSAPQDLPHTSLSFSNTYENETAEYTCHEGFVTDSEGTMTVTCLPDGRWTDCNVTCIGKGFGVKFEKGEGE